MNTKITRRSAPEWTSSWPENLHPRLQSIYAARGVNSLGDMERSLQAMLRPQQLKGLQGAVERLVRAIIGQESLLIVGDFDADGATSCAVGMLALRDMGAASVQYLVPNRFEFGYGLTPEIVAVAKGYKPDLIITVDNGISSIEGVAASKAAGIGVLVTDHHLPGHELPDAEAIVNPNQPGCEFPSKNLAGVGVIFYLMSALRSALREQGWFASRGIPEPNMGNYLDLVALGTVADVVPLDSNNRILVHQGLQRIRSGRARPGILALLEIAGRQRHRLVASDLGFTVGPRLNAAGRLDDMSLGIECLLCESPDLAREMAIELDDLNKDRRSIEAGMQQEALKSLQSLVLNDSADMPWGLCLYDGQWHQGVIGILASRIKERFHRPVIAFADASEEEIKGSARSIPGLHIRDALDAVASAHPGLLTKFGGHAMAAGMSLKKSDFPRFQQAFDEVVRQSLSQADLQAEILSDGALSADEFNLPLAHTLREAGPWGQHFPEPVFDGEFYLVQQRIVGEKHLKLVLAMDPAGQQLVDAIAFNVDVDVWPNPSAEKIKLAYRLDVNEFRGRETVQLMAVHVEAIG
ncbi:single-stranded-DNA-specific exonuclease RecJ [Aestuariicella hydrocarbonica]|uniref:Single-stranded-DNA-specific exonuclease RecJ n=1 Tax=Pseudomaricurvus hydrocarbonicus TaxID=1470433 RepID=A0A9E5JYK9_9GAMM|nr:single-stranded-DNA-specific exonuclease RecJ [Aestuariicella hydrocarbonica]NHO64517.1 single-stranded-DNA-specific exonuclease RecJ [Aestuariicella hydrocarbonica]